MENSVFCLVAGRGLMKRLATRDTGGGISALMSLCVLYNKGGLGLDEIWVARMCKIGSRLGQDWVNHAQRNKHFRRIYLIRFRNR
jgi:hypothetical protein